MVDKILIYKPHESQDPIVSTPSSVSHLRTRLQWASSELILISTGDESKDCIAFCHYDPRDLSLLNGVKMGHGANPNIIFFHKKFDLLLLSERG